jgi:hypothetical protein
MGRRTASRQQGHPRPWFGRAWMREALRTRNPLLRRPSRVERIVAALGLAALALIGVGVFAITWNVYADGGAQERGQAGGRSAISATVDSQPSPSLIGVQGTIPAFASVTYLWQGLDRDAIVPVASTSRPGDRVSVWIDFAGRLTGEPRSHVETILDSVATGTLGAAVFTVACYFGTIVYRAWAMRRRCALWDAEWLQFAARGQERDR